MRWLRCLASLFAIFFIAGCAHQTSASGPKDLSTAFWSGRLSLQVASEPPAYLSGGFELAGNAQSGSLLLFNPLGGTLAQLRWEPQSASLQTGSKSQYFESLGALARQLSGTPVPIAALFDWLLGLPTEAAGWRADLSRRSGGKLTAEREADANLPAATLRIALDAQ